MNIFDKSMSIKYRSKSPTKLRKKFLTVPKNEDRPDIFKISAENLWIQYKNKEDKMALKTSIKRPQTISNIMRRMSKEGYYLNFLFFFKLKLKLIYRVNT